MHFGIFYTYYTCMYVYMHRKVHCMIRKEFYDFISLSFHSAKVSRVVCMRGKISMWFNSGDPSGCIGRTKPC